jgi:hypothetical protein
LSDVSLIGVKRFIVIMIAFLAMSFVLVALMVWYFQGQAAAIDVKPSQVVPREGDRLPPVPRLLVDEPKALGEFRRVESQSLNSWAWVDKEKTVAEIPVSRAIEILVERGLPMPSVSARGSLQTAPASAAPAPSAPSPR